MPSSESVHPGPSYNFIRERQNPNPSSLVQDHNSNTHTRKVSVDTPRLPDDDSEDVITTYDQMKISSMSIPFTEGSNSANSGTSFLYRNSPDDYSSGLVYNNGSCRVSNSNEINSMISTSVASSQSGNSLASMPLAAVTKCQPAIAETTRHDVRSSPFNSTSKLIVESNDGLDQINEIVRSESQENLTKVPLLPPIEPIKTRKKHNRISIPMTDVKGIVESINGNNENSEPVTPSNQNQYAFVSNIRSLARSASVSHSKNGSESNINYSPSGSKIRANGTDNNDDDDEGTIKEEVVNGTTEIISYRRTSRKSSAPKTPSTLRDGETGAAQRYRSGSSNSYDGPISPISNRSSLDYDPRLYTDEKFMDTQYRYACSKRNVDFHSLFKKIPADERLLDDFSCALSREILLQGRLYVSEHYICFNSNLLGWVTSLVLSLDEIVSLEKRTTAGLFPNGIILSTKDSKHSFASFIARDTTLNFMEAIWSKSVTMSDKNHEKRRNIEVFESNGLNQQARNNTKKLSEDDIFTIDEDSDHDSSDSDKTGSPEVGRSSGDDSPKKSEVSKFVRQPTFEGPSEHDPTDFRYDYATNKETVLLEETFNAPLGFLFNLMFSETDLKFHQHIIQHNDGSNYSDYGPFVAGTEYNGNPSRDYEYEKKLNYSIGPKSTKVECIEILEHKDFNDHIVLKSITRTPNVPSGGAFEVVSRFVFTWAENNRTHLVLSYYINWKGSSWVKSIIEKSTLSGQQEAAGIYKNELPQFIPASFDAAPMANGNAKIAEPSVKSEVQSIRSLKSEKPIVLKVEAIPVPQTKLQAFQSLLFKKFDEFVEEANVNTYLLLLVILFQLLILFKFRSIYHKLQEMETFEKLLRSETAMNYD
ncbi:unnamed protein product [Ambrosiozyma monospora]|uniref:Unnamed protein product n=1 Tax=Ambrosiozyma monospora TaxID=43982 RepID=A0A9W7DHA8_AMBMO|nr:unnamed protein product [Ambrosiozyma monospora]